MHKILRKVRHLFPSPLPLTVDHLSAFIDEIMETYEFPEDPTYRHAMSAAIMHLGPLTTRKPKRFFAKSVYKQIANQVAFQKIEQIKRAEKEKLEAATLKKEVTPLTEPSDGPGLQGT